MTYKIGTIGEFAAWTKLVIRDPKAAHGKPKRWFGSPATARTATARAALGRPVAMRPGRGNEVSPEAMVKLLSPQNLRLLSILAKKRPRSVQALADLTGRNQASVSRTLKRLVQAGIVAMMRGNGREVRPELVATRVHLEIDLAGAKGRGVAVRSRAAG